MPKLDRGKLVGGYYITDSNCILYGAKWENCAPAGSAEFEGKEYGISFVLFYRDEINIKQNPHHAEAFDFDVLSADTVLQNTLVRMLLMDEDISSLMPLLPRSLHDAIVQDISDGYTGEQIIDRRGYMLGSKFLGENEEQVRRDYPEFIQTKTVDDGLGGTYTMECYKPCNLENIGV